MYRALFGGLLDLKPNPEHHHRPGEGIPPRAMPDTIECAQKVIVDFLFSANDAIDRLV